jgi:4-hydroxy-4-methyl-2-oxoglutarate aldolase
LLNVAAALIRPGDVAVVALSADNTDWMFGELLATSYRALGARGLVIGSGCRELPALRKLAFPVWLRAIAPRSTVKAAVGSVNVPVVCGGALVQPGEVVGAVAAAREQKETAKWRDFVAKATIERR